MKRKDYMLSDFPPWQAYRRTYDSDAGIDVIEFYDSATGEWIERDNDLLRGAFMDQQDAGLSTSYPISDAQAAKFTSEGWDAIK